jgi:hypothetical protein
MGMNLALGSRSHPSIIDIERCEPVYWVLQGVFIWICVIYTIVAILKAQSEQQLKMRFGNINLVDSDIRYHGKSLTTLVLLGFLGGMAAGALGIGGGAIFTPSLLGMGVPPLVVTGTGLYLVFFSTSASSLIYHLNGELNTRLGLWIAVWAIAGTIIGLRMMMAYIKRTGKHSIVVWVLVYMFVVSVIAVPLFGGINLKKQFDMGQDLLAFRPLCT